MTERVEGLLNQIRSREYRARRETVKEPNMRDGYSLERHVWNLRRIAELEKPVLYRGDRLGFHRSTSLRLGGTEGNITPNYSRVMTQGLDAIAAQINESMAGTDDEGKLALGRAMLDGIDVWNGVAERYRAYAAQTGCTELAEALETVPRKGATTFYEACVFLKMIIYILRLTGTVHLTLGRFDQYMYPFFRADRERGASDEELFELVEEFFLSINFDTDLYVGVQQGDNGQSMVLGGFDRDGNSMYNALSEMCMKASLELKVIDPKINLRVGKNTPDELYVFATQLTREGLGFPQYCNDDVVVKGLVELGYDYEDALDYTVAACWEYIIPNCGADIPNIETMDFPRVVGDVIVEKLSECESFDALMEEVKEAVRRESKRLVESKLAERPSIASPLLSMCMDGCIESLTDAFHGGTKYNNYGSHGAGIANAADALEAVKKTVFEDGTVSKDELLAALANNFVGYTELRNLLCDCPKMGNNEESVDSIACTLMDTFSKSLNNRSNGHNGIWRAGTGSAMEYIYKGEKCPATADGRRAGEPYSSSYSPSLNARTDGLLSVIQSFTKYDLSKIVNGGPLTIEVHDTVLRNEIGIRKTAALVKEFVLAGGHQLQINSVNRERLLDAQKHPEKYPNLIVRVWGWSGYFNELDVKYQNHIIQRTEFLG